VNPIPDLPTASKAKKSAENFLTPNNPQQQEIELPDNVRHDSRINRLAWLFSFQFFQRTLLGLTAIIALFFFVEAARLMPVHGENMTAESSTV